MTVEHAFSCSFGGFPSIIIMNCRISLLPCCQKSAKMFALNHHYNLCQKNNFNVEDGAWLDVSAESFSERDKKMAFFDVILFNSLTTSYASSPLAQCYRRAELDKKKMYDK